MKQIALKNWWILTLKGLLTLVFGIFALSLTVDQLMLFSKFFGMILLAGGLTLIILSVLTKKYNDRSWKTTEGFIDILIGTIVLAFPRITPGIFLATIAIWISFIGIIQVMNGYRLRSLYHHWWFLIFNAILAIAFALIIFTNPLLETSTLMIIIGLQAVVIGGFLVISSIYIKRLIDDVRIELPQKKGEEGNQELSYY